MANSPTIYIVGGGPAGLTSAIYLAREGDFKPVVFEKAVAGGLAALADRFENYPGFPGGIAGGELALKMEEQAKKLGAEIIHEEIKSIVHTGEDFLLTGVNGGYSARAFILAAGTLPRKLGIPGEDEFTGRGVSFCAICDAPLYRGKRVAVIGGGNTALQEALHLARFADRVYIVHRRTSFRAFPKIEEEARKNPKIEFVLNAKPVAIDGDNVVRGITVEYAESYERMRIDLDGVFVFIGWLPNTGIIQFELDRDKDGYIITDEWCMSSKRGMFVAGDIRSKPLRQVITASADGAIAAVGIAKFLRGEIQ